MNDIVMTRTYSFFQLRHFGSDTKELCYRAQGDVGMVAKRETRASFESTCGSGFRPDGSSAVCLGETSFEQEKPTPSTNANQIFTGKAMSRSRQRTTNLATAGC
jgi:hypothetical protein